MDRRWSKLTLLLFSLVLFPSLLYGMPLWMIGGNPTSSCPSGTYKFAWNGDYSGDTDKGCFNSSASTKNGTLGGNAVISGTYGQVGNGIGVFAHNDKLSWVVLGDDGLNDEIGTIWMSIYPVAETGDIRFFESVSSGATCYMDCWLNSAASYKPRCDWSDGVNTQLITHDANAPGTGAWSRFAYSWDTTNNKHSIYMGGTWHEHTSATMDAWTQDPDDITLGEDRVVGDTANQDDIYIDNFYVLSTYQASDPY